MNPCTNCDLCAMAELNVNRFLLPLYSNEYTMKKKEKNQLAFEADKIKALNVIMKNLATCIFAVKISTWYECLYACVLDLLCLLYIRPAEPMYTKRGGEREGKNGDRAEEDRRWEWSRKYRYLNTRGKRKDIWVKGVKKNKRKDVCIWRIKIMILKQFTKLPMAWTLHSAHSAQLHVLFLQLGHIQTHP